MRILYLMDQMYLHGGGEKILSQKINYFINHYGYDIHFFTTEQKNNKEVYNIDSKLIWKDLKINYTRDLSYFHPKNLLKIIYHFKKLKNEIRKIQPDVIVSVSYSPEQYFLPFLYKQIPKVKEFHSSGVTIKKPNSFMEKMKYRLFLLFGRYDALVVLNEDEKKYYPFSNLTVIPNFIAVSKAVQAITKEKTIIAAGRIAAVKQFDHLISAWRLIAAKHPDWQVKIFGDGDEILTAQLNQQIQELKIPNIHLMGATAHLDYEMQKASLYAMTSATECFPMVLLEAQAAGLPIISYDCPNGPRQIIHHKIDGILTPANEITIFADKLNWLIANEALRDAMGSQAKKNVKTHSQGRVMQQWNDLFEKINCH